MFFLGGWLSVLSGMAISLSVFATLFETAQRLRGGVIWDSRGDIVIAGPLILAGALVGGWLSGRIYRRAYAAMASRTRWWGKRARFVGQAKSIAEHGRESTVS